MSGRCLSTTHLSLTSTTPVMPYSKEIQDKSGRWEIKNNIYVLQNHLIRVKNIVTNTATVVISTPCRKPKNTFVEK